MFRLHTSIICAAAVSLALFGCATPPDDPQDRAQWEEENDPLEPLNREIFAVNRVIDGLLIKPAAMIYRGVVPDEGRTAIRNVLGNLKEPVYLANNLLQGDLPGAGDTVARFAINTTAGVAGIWQPSADMGLPRRPTGFGTTLHIWGTGEGPYLVLPILGPSNPRDAVGLVADTLMDPFMWIASANDLDWITYLRTGLDALDRRANVLDSLDEIERTSLDFYAQIRTLYRQQRKEELRRAAERVSAARTEEIERVATLVAEDEIERVPMLAGRPTPGQPSVAELPPR
ncbi:MAG: VacJ family lipoprotein [Alphaproteobacteria bacterium]